MKSILQDTKECYLCRIEATRRGYNEELTDRGIDEHHIFFGVANRKVSEKHGLKLWLCHNRHHLGAEGPHMSKLVDLSLKGIAQREFEKNHTREEFIKEFGRSWL
jgi:hypothetical protein